MDSRDARESVPPQLSQAKIFPAEHGFHAARDERARRQHQRGVRREINCDFDPISPRAHTTALLCRFVASKITGTGKMCASRYPRLVAFRTFDFCDVGNEKL